jgi:hypothetical protein
MYWSNSSDPGTIPKISRRLVTDLLPIGQLCRESKLAADADLLYSGPQALLITNAASLETCMSRFMQDYRGNHLRRCCVGENKTLVELAGADRPVEASNGSGELFHPYAIEIPDQAIIAKPTVFLDQIMRFFHTLQNKLGLCGSTLKSNPQPINASAERKAKRDPIQGKRQPFGKSWARFRRRFPRLAHMRSFKGLIPLITAQAAENRRREVRQAGSALSAR